MKKFTASILAVVLAASTLLAGCGNTADKDSKGTENPAAAETPVSTETPAATKAPEPINVTYVYGTASLTYAEFYAGDVTSTDDFDAVSSATNSKHSIMSNMYTDFVDQTANAAGYHILGVKNVNVAVAENDVEAYKAINPTFVPTGSEAPAQYKTVTLADGKASYSATNFNKAAVVKDATYTLSTSSNWGDYLICVADTSEKHLRNTREDEFDINSSIQGIIVETSKGFKVGLEALQSIWVQTYEFSFNVSADSKANSRIAVWDNIPQLSKLVGEKITKVYYIMQNSTYEYDFDGIYVKPFYTGNAYAATRNGAQLTLSANDFSAFTNPKLTVTYTVGTGRNAVKSILLDSEAKTGTATYTLDMTAYNNSENKSGSFTAVLSSDNYADVAVTISASDEQKAALNAAIENAATVLATSPKNADALKAHIEEAKEILSDGKSSAAVASIINELTNLVNKATDTTDKQNGQGH